MRIEGSFEVAAPREVVWAAIRDPAVVAPCVPGCEGVEARGSTSYRTVVMVTLGPIKARFNLDVEITAEMPPERIESRTRGEEGTQASRVSAENVLSLEALDADCTRVGYASDVAVTGRLAKFGFGLMKKKADALGRDFAKAFRARIETGSGAA